MPRRGLSLLYFTSNRFYKYYNKIKLSNSLDSVCFYLKCSDVALLPAKSGAKREHAGDGPAAAQNIPASHKQEMFEIVHVIAQLRKEGAQNLEEVEAHLAHIMGHNCSHRFT